MNISKVKCIPKHLYTCIELNKCYNCLKKIFFIANRYQKDRLKSVKLIIYHCQDILFHPILWFLIKCRDNIFSVFFSNSFYTFTWVIFILSPFFFHDDFHNQQQIGHTYLQCVCMCVCVCVCVSTRFWMLDRSWVVLGHFQSSPTIGWPRITFCTKHTNDFQTLKVKFTQNMSVTCRSVL